MSPVTVEEMMAADPWEQFRRWRAEAVAAGVPTPDAMVLATADRDGAPDARTVMLTGLDERGFRFFTDDRSAKAHALDANPRAALVFGWYGIGRQVRVAGTVTRVSRAESAAQFATASREDRLAVWACRQSTVVPDRATLDAAYAEAQARWPEGEEIPLPDFWGGYRVEPIRFDFWQGGAHNVNDRFRYRREPTGGWIRERLAP